MDKRSVTIQVGYRGFQVMVHKKIQSRAHDRRHDTIIPLYIACSERRATYWGRRHFLMNMKSHRPWSHGVPWIGSTCSCGNSPGSKSEKCEPCATTIHRKYVQGGKRRNVAVRRGRGPPQHKNRQMFHVPSRIWGRKDKRDGYIKKTLLIRFKSANYNWSPSTSDSSVRVMNDMPCCRQTHTTNKLAPRRVSLSVEDSAKKMLKHVTETRESCS